MVDDDWLLGLGADLDDSLDNLNLVSELNLSSVVDFDLSDSEVLSDDLDASLLSGDSGELLLDSDLG